MRYHLQWKVYRRPFVVPLETAYGIWKAREGVVLRLEDDDGRVGYGEAAPLEQFGGESLHSVLSVLREAHAVMDEAELGRVMGFSGCCGFALGSALWMMELGEAPMGSFANTALLPNGETGIRLWNQLREQGYTRAKWKIGVQDAEADIALLRSLPCDLLPDCRFRLDANGTLSASEWQVWQSFLQTWNGLDYLEQPMQPGEETAMVDLSSASSVPLALDESLTVLEAEALGSLRDQWPGFFVLKPALLGDPRTIRFHWSAVQQRCVLSSGFETGIGWWALLQLAQHWQLDAPMGAGWLDAFADGCTVIKAGPRISGYELTPECMTEIWGGLRLL